MPRHFLRPSTSRDSAFIYAVCKITSRHLVEGVGRRWAEARMREKSAAESNDGLTQIVMVEDRPAGFFSIEERDNEVWLHALFLLPGFQRLGFGRQIIADALAQAGGSGRRVRCQVMSFDPAIAFYGRLGFEVCKEEDDCVSMESSA